ncbi:suppressor of fused domain protein [Chitinophaga sp. CF418]|uniref:suppressor of fused domain protein n=1 Tax=Chitinophaga sp. CF418 TaxID=1855287 RepID=UPI00091398A1|nr:suppressor of fused domain protein [Chitinophaga sp. CF418]SHM00617.1 Suppressor of fused protein (SUFU) [Chitinophaga sp. CF418]
METYEEHFENSCKLRNEYWEAIGKLDPDVIAHLINPSFMGGPTWPSVRQAFATIRLQEHTIIASDGLSDPYEDMESNTTNAPYNGFGLEVYVLAEEITGRVNTTWEFQLAYQAAQLIADHGNVVALLDEMTYITTEFYNVDVPKEFVNAEGRVGAILGLPDEKIPATVQLTLEPVKMVNVKLLTLAELDYVVIHGEEGRMKLAALLIQQGSAALSSLNRPSVV